MVDAIAGSSSDSQRRVLDSFTWFEGDEEDADQDDRVQEMLKRLDKAWLTSLNSCGRRRQELVEIVFQMGRRPKAIFDDGAQKETIFLSESATCEKKHLDSLLADTKFDWRKRLKTQSSKDFCIPSSLHRVSISTKSENDPTVTGITTRVGRSLPGGLGQMCPWLVNSKITTQPNGQPFVFANKSVLIIGPPGSGKTTILRELANGLSRVGRNAIERTVVVVDKINEIAGESDSPHPCIGEAQWMPCDNPDFQAKAMREAVQNLSPDVIIVDALADPGEVDAARAVFLRGVSLIASAQGSSLVDILNCSTRSMLLGGMAPNKNNTADRIDTPVFDVAIEIVQRDCWIVHPNVKDTVDRYLKGQRIDAIELRPGLSSAVIGIPSAEGMEYCGACATGRCTAKHAAAGPPSFAFSPEARKAAPPSTPTKVDSAKERQPVADPTSPSSSAANQFKPLPAVGRGHTSDTDAKIPSFMKSTSISSKSIRKSLSQSPGDSPGGHSEATWASSPGTTPVNQATTPNKSLTKSLSTKSLGGDDDNKPLPSYMCAKVAKADFGDPENLFDPKLLVVADKMSDGLVSYYKSLGIHTGIAGNWAKFFADIDDDGSGRMTFEELDDAVRNKLRAKLTRYELRVFWRNLDADGSGLVTLKEFADIMYRLKVNAWPDLSEKRLDRTIRLINESAEKWHRCGGNWYKIFRNLNPQGGGSMTFDEFSQCMRSTFPGLDLRADKVSDDDFKGLWKAMDDDYSQEVSGKEFMKFMRTNGSQYNMHKLTEYSKAKQGKVEVKRDISGEIRDATQLDDVQLGNVAARLAATLQQWLAVRGCGSGVARSDAPCFTLWERLFGLLDGDGSGRLGFEEFEEAALNDLKVEQNGISMDELKALWRNVDGDGSLEITEKEFCLGIYRLQLEECPILSDETIKRHVRILNKAGDKWHRASGNWFKIFNACDQDGSGEMDFEEMVGVVRESFPCLSIPAKELPYHELRGLWRCIDDDKSGKVDFKEFMYFMRIHAPHLTKLTEYSKKKRGLIDEEQDRLDAIIPNIERSSERLQEIARSLDEALALYWAKRGVHTNVSGNWGKFFEEADDDGSGRLGLSELEEFLSTRLRSRGCPPGDLIKGITKDDLIGLWNKVDADGSGLVTVKEWELCLYRMEVETWPDADPKTLTRVADLISKAAGKWHHCGGNWYKIFRLIDTDGSGEIGYEELKCLCYGVFPDLQMSLKVMPEEKLKALWKALDDDLSGMTSTAEFMIFMRANGSEQFVKNAATISVRKKAPDDDSTKKLSPEQMKIFTEALSGQTLDSLKTAFAQWDIPWTGYITEWDMLYIIRTLLDISEDDIPDDGIVVVWGMLEQDESKKVRPQTLLALGGQKEQARFGGWSSSGR